MQKKKLLSIGEAANYLGISRDTLRRWEKRGKIAPLRSPTERRYYTKNMLSQLINKEKKVVAISEATPKLTKKTNLTRLIIFAIISFFVAAVIVSLLQLFIL